MTAIGELAGLSRGALLARLREAEARAERATGFAMAAIGDVSNRVDVVARESNKARIFATVWKQKARQERSGKQLVARTLDRFVREVSREVGEETGNVTDAIEMVDALVAEHQGARLALSTLLTAEKQRAEESARADHAMYMASGWRRLAVEMLRHADREADAARASEAIVERERRRADSYLDQQLREAGWRPSGDDLDTLIDTISHGLNGRGLGATEMTTIRTLRTLRRERDRAEMRLACWALADFFRTWRWELRGTRCKCGHVGVAHQSNGACMAGAAYVHDSRNCDCRAFDAVTEGT